MPGSSPWHVSSGSTDALILEWEGEGQNGDCSFHSLTPESPLPTLHKPSASIHSPHSGEENGMQGEQTNLVSVFNE